MISARVSGSEVPERSHPLVRPVNVFVFALALGVGASGWDRVTPMARAAEPQMLTLKGIGDGIKTQWDRIESMRVEHETKAEALAPHDVIKKYSLLGSLDGMQETFAFKGSKRYYHYVEPPVVTPLSPDVDPDYDVIPGGREIRKQIEDNLAAIGLRTKPSPRAVRVIAASKTYPFEVGFDGKDFHQREPIGNAMVLDARTMPGFGKNFVQKYLNNIDRVLPDPIGSPDDAKRNCFPEVPLRAGFTLRSASEDFDGAHCVVVENRGRERIWFDPATNFGVRKHEILDPHTGIVVERRVNGDFAEVSRGIWLPKECYREVCGPPLGPQAFRGKPLYREVYLVNRITVNDVADVLFTVDIPAGAQVFDATRQPRKGDKNRYVVYGMPADSSEIDETVRRALLEGSKRRLEANRKPSIWSGVFALNLVVIAIIAVIFLWKKKARE